MWAVEEVAAEMCVEMEEVGMWAGKFVCSCIAGPPVIFFFLSKWKEVLKLGG